MAKGGSGSAGYVLGILSIVFAFFNSFAGLVIGIIGYSQGKKGNDKRAKKLSIIGIVLSIIFIALMVVSLFIWEGALNTGGF